MRIYVRRGQGTKYFSIKSLYNVYNEDENVVLKGDFSTA